MSSTGACGPPGIKVRGNRRENSRRRVLDDTEEIGANEIESVNVLKTVAAIRATSPKLVRSGTDPRAPIEIPSDLVWWPEYPIFIEYAAGYRAAFINRVRHRATASRARNTKYHKVNPFVVFRAAGTETVRESFGTVRNAFL